MSYILSTIYPAPTGIAAARYAAGLAQAMSVPLRIILPYVVPVSIGEVPMPIIPIEEVRDDANARLAQATADLSKEFAAVPVTTEAVYGNLSDILEDEEGDYAAAELAVICNGEAEDEIWLSHDTSDMLRKGARLVLAIPADKEFSQPKLVCLACDGTSVRDGLPLSGLLSLRQKLGFGISVLHVVSGDEQSVSYSGSALEAQLRGLSVSYAEVSAQGNIDEAIAAFADTQGIDWLAMAPHHYGFWAGLFHKSHTTRVLHLAHVPVLALHN